MPGSEEGFLYKVLVVGKKRQEIARLWLNHDNDRLGAKFDAKIYQISFSAKESSAEHTLYPISHGKKTKKRKAKHYWQGKIITKNIY